MFALYVIYMCCYGMLDKFVYDLCYGDWYRFVQQLQIVIPKKSAVCASQLYQYLLGDDVVGSVISVTLIWIIPSCENMNASKPTKTDDDI